MARWVYGGFPEYVPVAERQAKALLQARKLEKRGRKLDPVKLDGKRVASSFWGKAWCANIESYSDFSNRLPRGRTYLRSGSVVDLLLAEGRLEALVAGSSLYQCKIEINARAQPLDEADAAGAAVQRCSGQIDSTVALLQGQVPEELLEAIVDRDAGLFPVPREMDLFCSCPDSAQLCKHLAAVLYGVGARLDRSPELFFTLRSVKMAELVVSAAEADARRARGGRAGIALRHRNRPHPWDPQSPQTVAGRPLIQSALLTPVS
jgi:uncharacterized Zn finger protein